MKLHSSSISQREIERFIDVTDYKRLEKEIGNCPILFKTINSLSRGGYGGREAKTRMIIDQTMRIWKRVIRR